MGARCLAAVERIWCAVRHARRSRGESDSLAAWQRDAKPVDECSGGYAWPHERMVG